MSNDKPTTNVLIQERMDALKAEIVNLNIYDRIDRLHYTLLCKQFDNLQQILEDSKL